mgnify:CR=1 FL=1
MANLYKLFNCDLPKDDLAIKEQNTLIKAINNLDNENQKLLFLIIYEHYIQSFHITHEVKSSFAYVRSTGGAYDMLPYNCKYENKNISFTISEFPISLKHIIVKFINYTQNN